MHLHKLFNKAKSHNPIYRAVWGQGSSTANRGSDFLVLSDNVVSLRTEQVSGYGSQALE